MKKDLPKIKSIFFYLKQLGKWQTNKQMIIETYISIITLNINGLNAPTKRHRLAEWLQNQGSYVRCLQKIHFRPRETYRLKVRE